MRNGSPILRGLASTTPLLIALVGCGSNSATQQGSMGGSGAGGMGGSKVSSGGGTTALGGEGGAGGDKGGAPAGGSSGTDAGGGGAPGSGGGPSANDHGSSGNGGAGIGGAVADDGGNGEAAGSLGGAGGAAGGASGGPGGGAGAVEGGGGGADGSSNLPGGVEWEPWPAVPAVSADVCQVVVLHGGDALSPPVPLDIEIREFTPATGIVKSQFAAFGNQSASISYSVFTAQGYGVGGCNVTAGPDSCTEWVRDTHGNVTATDSPAYDGRNLSLLDASQFGTQAHGSVLTRYTVTYDAAGTLASGRNAGCCGDPARTFTEDAQHRCSDVLWEKLDDAGGTPTGASELEHWTWEGDRLVSRVTTTGADPSKVRSVVTYTYDAAGILATTVVDGYATLSQGNSQNAVPDGITDYLVRTVMLADGSRWVESLDFHFYKPDANVVRDGKLTPAGRLRSNFSPGCRDVHPARRTSTACQFEPVQNQLGVRWDDPYTTPIRR